MKIVHCEGYAEMSQQAAAVLLGQIGQKPNLLLCAATGSSPAGLYDQLAGKAVQDASFFNQLRVIKLDEWGGLPDAHPASCEYYLRTKLLEPLAITPDRYLSFHSDPPDPVGECDRLQAALEAHGPVDVCILGLGANGHLGFNEPAAFLTPHCHVAHLSEQSLGHSMVQTLQDKPAYGLTLGMADILRARKIILLIWGQNKQPVVEAWLTRRISTQLPASLLWLHPDVHCFIGKPA
jgi:galactosamine-6-phosphate isomerase